jgi:hypothetical protein
VWRDPGGSAGHFVDEGAAAGLSGKIRLQIIPNTTATRKPNDMIVASTSSRGVISSIDASYADLLAPGQEVF